MLFSEKSSQILYLMYHIRHIRLGCISSVALHHITTVMCCDRLAMQCVSWKMGKDVISWTKCCLSFMVFSRPPSKEVAVYVLEYFLKDSIACWRILSIFCLFASCSPQIINRSRKKGIFCYLHFHTQIIIHLFPQTFSKLTKHFLGEGNFFPLV